MYGWSQLTRSAASSILRAHEKTGAGGRSRRQESKFNVLPASCSCLLHLHLTSFS